MTETYKLETYPMKSKIDNLATKIILGLAAGAGASRGSTTGAGDAGEAAGGGGKVSSLWSAIANAAGGGCSARRNVNATFTELHRTSQGAAKTPLFEARAARHHAQQHAGLAAHVTG